MERNSGICADLWDGGVDHGAVHHAAKCVPQAESGEKPGPDGLYLCRHGLWQDLFCAKVLEKRRHIYLSCGDRRWDESALPARGTVVLDDMHLLDESRRSFVRGLIADPEIWLILVNRSPVPSWLMPEYVNMGFIVISENDMCLGKKEIRGYLDSLGLSYTEEGLQYLTDTAEGKRLYRAPRGAENGRGA